MIRTANLMKVLFDEAKKKYYGTQQCYARYVDENQAFSKKNFRTEEKQLQNEMLLAYNLYDYTAQ